MNSRSTSFNFPLQRCVALAVFLVSVHWCGGVKVDELDKATGVAEKDPARFSVDAAEIDKRKKWTSSIRIQVPHDFDVRCRHYEMKPDMGC